MLLPSCMGDDVLQSNVVRTIEAYVRKNNVAALKKINREFVLIWRELEAPRGFLVSNTWHMRTRACLAEHPFGTMRNDMGWRYLLLRGFEKVCGEMNLQMLVYNFKRVLKIIGMERILLLYLRSSVD